MWETLRKRGEYDPPSTQGTVLFPGMDGGAEWGGVAFDPRLGLLYVNANEMAWRVKLAERKMPDGGPVSGKTLYLRYCAACHRADLNGTPPEFPSLAGIGTRATRRSPRRSARAAAACRRLPTCTPPFAGRSSTTS